MAVDFLVAVLAHDYSTVNLREKLTLVTTSGSTVALGVKPSGVAVLFLVDGDVGGEDAGDREKKWDEKISESEPEERGTVTVGQGGKPFFEYLLVENLLR